MHVVFIVSINRKMKLLDPIEIYRKCSNLKKNCLQLVFFHWSVWIFYLFNLVDFWVYVPILPVSIQYDNMKAHWRYLLLLTFLYYSLFYLSFPIKFCSLCCRWLRNRLSHFLIQFFNLLVLSFCTLTKISLCKCYDHQHPIIYYLTRALHFC